MTGQIDAAIRHHAMESGAFVVNSTAWLSDDQGRQIAPDEGSARLLRGGQFTAIVSPDGAILAGPLGEGEDMAVAEIDLRAVTSRKLLLDTVGHYARPDILRLLLNDTPQNCVEPFAPESSAGNDAPALSDSSVVSASPHETDSG